MPGRRAGPGVGKYNAESPKQDSKRFNSITKTNHFPFLGISFIYVEPSLFLCTWKRQQEASMRLTSVKKNRIWTRPKF